MPPPGGARVAGYEIVAEIGRGGMGVVYLAEGADGTHVAVKTVLPDHRGDADRLAMIADEAALASRLDHPHIVAVRELADHEGTPALVLDYVHGESLAALLVETTRLPAPLVARIGADVAGALAAAAAAGVVHRDVAPHNVLLGYDGSVRLGDFGIAWSAEGREAVTAAGVVKGRVAYMAPEQLAGAPVSAAADVYALGVMLIRALVGRLPDRDADTGRALEMPATLAPEWRDLVEGAVAEEPDARRDAASIAAELEAWAAPRAELAALLSERFADSRELKESIIARGGDLASSETEVLDTGETEAAGTATEHVTRPRRLGVAGGLAIAGMVAGAVALWSASRNMGSGPAPPATEPVKRPATGPPCVVSGAVQRAADRDPTYVAVRLTARLLDPVAIAGFRDGDRCPPGSQMAAVVGSAEGRASVSIGEGAPLSIDAARPAAQARAMAAAIAGQLDGVEPSAVELADHDWRRYLRLLQIREIVYLMVDPGSRSVLEAAVREDGGDLEHVYIVNAIEHWVSGSLDPKTLARPERASAATEAVLDAIVALAAGDTAAARERVAAATGAGDRDASAAVAPLVDLVAGEAAFHGGDPVAGAAAFERALAAEPDLLNAIYHLARHRMARGDWPGVEALAKHWERRNPAAESPPDLRARILAGRGDYDAALPAFEAIVREGIAGPARSAEVGRILVLALAGREDAALEAAKAMAEVGGGEPHVVSVTPEPAGYALALARGDEAEIAYWSRRLDLMLDGKWSENHIALAATVDLLDHIAGAKRAHRLPADVPPARRSYRYRDRLALLALLRGDATAADSTLVAATREALAAESAGDVAAAEAAYRRALDSTAEGELDCAILWRWAELARKDNLESRDAICERIAHPRVPTALCVVARCP